MMPKAKNFFFIVQLFIIIRGRSLDKISRIDRITPYGNATTYCIVCLGALRNERCGIFAKMST